jgi:hypothetical protein
MFHPGRNVFQILCYFSLNKVVVGFCSSETKHDKRAAPRPNLFGRGDYRNKGQSPEKIVLGSSPGKNVFRTSETNDGRRIFIRPT